MKITDTERIEVLQRILNDGWVEFEGGKDVEDKPYVSVSCMGKPSFLASDIRIALDMLIERTK